MLNIIVTTITIPVQEQIDEKGVKNIARMFFKNNNAANVNDLTGEMF